MLPTISKGMDLIHNIQEIDSNEDRFALQYLRNRFK